MHDDAPSTMHEFKLRGISKVHSPVSRVYHLSHSIVPDFFLLYVEVFDTIVYCLLLFCCFTETLVAEPRGKAQTMIMGVVRVVLALIVVAESSSFDEICEASWFANEIRRSDGGKK